MHKAGGEQQPSKTRPRPETTTTRRQTPQELPSLMSVSEVKAGHRDFSRRRPCAWCIASPLNRCGVGLIPGRRPRPTAAQQCATTMQRPQRPNVSMPMLVRCGSARTTTHGARSIDALNMSPSFVQRCNAVVVASVVRHVGASPRSRPRAREPQLDLGVVARFGAPLRKGPLRHPTCRPKLWRRCDALNAINRELRLLGGRGGGGTRNMADEYRRLLWRNHNRQREELFHESTWGDAVDNSFIGRAPELNPSCGTRLWWPRAKSSHQSSFVSW